VPIGNYSIILGKEWKALTNGYMSMEGTHIALPKARNKIIVLPQEYILLYIESVPQTHVSYGQDDIGIYNIFLEDDDLIPPPIDLNNGICNMHFEGNGPCSNGGNGIGIVNNGVGIVLYSPVGKIYKFSYRIEFDCTNIITYFEALLLVI